MYIVPACLTPLDLSFRLLLEGRNTGIDFEIRVERPQIEGKGRPEGLQAPYLKSLSYRSAVC